MGKKINLNFLVFTLLTLFSFILFFPIFFGKIPFNGSLLVSFWFPWKEVLPFKFMGVDEAREFFPLLDFTYDSLKQGSVPLWNPYNFSGYPHFANWASAIFYPFHIAFFFLSKTNALIFMKITSLILAGFFTYLYLTSLKLSSKSSFFGSITFAFSSILVVWSAEIWQSVHSFIWLPLVLFSIEKYFNDKKIIYLFLGSFSLSLSVLAGYTHPTIYVFLFSLSYVFLKVFSSFNLAKNIKQIFPFFIMFVLGLLLSAVHLIPSVEFFFNAPRQEIALTNINLNFLLKFPKIVTFFVPDFFGHFSTGNLFYKGPGQYYEQMIYLGVVTLVLTPLSFFLKKYKRYFLYFLAWAIISLASVFDLPSSKIIYFLKIPYLSTAIPIRIIFITVFSFSVLSAFGVEWWFNSSRKDLKKIFISLLPLIIIYGLIAVFILLAFYQKVKINNFPRNWYLISFRNFVIPGFIFFVSLILIFLGLQTKRLKIIAFSFLVIISFVQSFMFTHKYLSFTEKELIYPPHPLIKYVQANLGFNRYWGYGNSSLENNFATVYKIYSPEGYDPLNVKHYNELLSSANTGDFQGIASRSDALIPNQDLAPTRDTNTKRLKLLDLLGVKLVGYLQLNGEKAVENDHFKLVWEKEGFQIYENKKSFNRAFLLSQIEFASSREETIKKVFDPKTDLLEKVILEDKNVPNLDLKRDVGSFAKIVDYKPGKVVVEANTNTPQVLILSDTYYPGWTAKINGNPTKIYKANYTFRAVFLPSGKSQVVFYYRPKSLYIGSAISLVSIFAILAFFTYRLFYKREK